MRQNPALTTITPQQRRIAYHYTQPANPQQPITVMFLGGFYSNMQGSKALFLEQHCRTRNIPYLRMDYSGHGESSGEFTDGCVGDWLDDALHILDTIIHGDVLLVGSSMGGWIALLLALARPHRVKSLLGIASAPDFTEALIWQQLPPEAQHKIMAEGSIALPEYPITKKLIEDGRKHLLLHAPVLLTCPVQLLHGMQDVDVPYHISEELLQRIPHDDVTLTLLKGGDHRLSTPAALHSIGLALDGLLMV